MIKRLSAPLRYWGLLYALTLRSLQIRYKQSILGIAWAIIQPMALMLMFTLVFSRLLKINSEGIPYPLFVYSSLLPWTFFSNSLNGAIPSLEANAALIKKIYFPRELFPISAVLAAFVDFLIAALIFVGMMFNYHIHPTVNILYVVPILLIQTILALGISFFASALNVYYRDVKHALPLIIQLWFYASPVIYPLSLVPQRLQNLFVLNPMAGIMESYRTILVKGQPPGFHYTGAAAGVSLLLLVLGYLYFKRIEMNVADVV